MVCFVDVVCLSVSILVMEYLIRTYTNENETVLDFAIGSGTTGVACVNLDRRFIGIELDSNYFSIAEERISRASRVKESPCTMLKRK